MYRLGKRSPSFKRRLAFTITPAFVVLAILAIGGFKLSQALHAKPDLKQSAAIVTHPAEAQLGPTKRYDEGTFTIDIPTGWTIGKHDSAPYDVYRWESGDTATKRLLEVYIDTIPQNYAVNRMVAVQSQSNHMALIGEASDNCMDFTKMTTPVTSTGTHARWQGIDFLCDLANYERDVVGTGSSDGINTVKLTGPTQGMHQVFFSYTDNNINPDFTTFYTILRGFQVK